jgi:V/A-type H+-transporting ATPase subunit K
MNREARNIFLLKRRVMYRMHNLTLALCAVLVVSLCVITATTGYAADVDTSAEETEAAKSENGGSMRVLGLALGAALAVGLCAIGTGYAQSRIGAAGMGALAEKPELVGPVIIGIAIPETLVILGFVIASMIILLI